MCSLSSFYRLDSLVSMDTKTREENQILQDTREGHDIRGTSNRASNVSSEASSEESSEVSSQNTPHTGGQKRKGRRIHWIPVVAGFLRKDGKVLVGQRPETHSLAGLWEFPGGKIELGESPEQALKRELNEELGIDAEIGKLQMACTHTYGGVGIVILFFEVRFWKGDPKAKHHLMLEWIHPEELRLKKIPEANLRMLPRILQCLGVSNG